MDDADRLADLEDEIAALDTAMGDARGMAAAFNAELGRVGAGFARTGRDVEVLERGLSRGLRRAIRGAVLDGDSLSESLRNLTRGVVDTAFNAAIRPVSDQLGGTLAQGLGGLLGGILPFANGGSFAQGRVQPFAGGGVVGGPVAFPLRGGRTGLLGEAGPEAILPLARGADGRLGVRTAGAGAGGGAAPVSVVMNIRTPDADSFRRSRAQIAAELGRAVSRGARNR